MDRTDRIIGYAAAFIFATCALITGHMHCPTMCGWFVTGSLLMSILSAFNFFYDLDLD